MSRYVGQCSVVRRRSATDEANWHEMMRVAKRVTPSSFLRHVDLSPILDDDETPREFLANAFAQDPDAGVFRSVWGDQLCWFITSAGFDFIFLDA